MGQQKQRNRRWVLASRPHGAPVPENFRLEEDDVATPGEGQVLLRTVYLSLDPYMRGRMSDEPSYSPPVDIGGVMVGGTVSRVVESNHPDYQPGDWVLGFDVCLDHHADDFAEQLVKACPKGIDIYYENVGGKVFDAVLPLLNTSARIPVCGLVSSYNATELPPGPDRLPLLMATVLKKRIRLQGFIIAQDYGHRIHEFQKEMGQWVKEDKIHYHEDITDGLENAPQTFIGLLKGKNFGKVVIRVAGDD
ncbi:NADP-dependent oxidoreductase [Escherichia coli]